MYIDKNWTILLKTHRKYAMISTSKKTETSRFCLLFLIYIRKGGSYMKNKSLSSLGFIVDSLDLSTSSISNALHVDSSLVSKWKSGNRILSPRSAYYDDFVTFLLNQKKPEFHSRLKDILLDLYPQEKIENEFDLERILHKALSKSSPINDATQNHFSTDHSTPVTAMVYENVCGRRESVTKMLEYAENMTSVGEFTFIDNEQYNWLLEDADFAAEFTKRMVNLIKRGFRARFVLYSSSDNRRLIQLFQQCSPLIFHRNILWYYKEYFDQSLMNYTIFILNKAISVSGLSVDGIPSSTMVFTDPSIVIKHELMAKQIMEQCKPFFHYFDILHIDQMISNVSTYRKTGTHYSFLPSPVFICVENELLSDILDSNQVDIPTRKKCRKISEQFRTLLFPMDAATEGSRDPAIYILQIEELIHRARVTEFTSRSLSLACGREIKISAAQYARELKQIVRFLQTSTDTNVILVSQKDNIYLPNVNCWCKQNIWMIQMTKDGLRISNEYSLVNAASNMWEQYYRLVPSERKNKESVCQFLNELIDSIPCQ